jgi:hypothetical protein
MREGGVDCELGSEAVQVLKRGLLSQGRYAANRISRTTGVQRPAALACASPFGRDRNGAAGRLQRLVQPALDRGGPRIAVVNDPAAGR